MFINSNSNMIVSAALAIVYVNKENISKVNTGFAAEQRRHADAQV